MSLIDTEFRCEALGLTPVLGKVAFPRRAATEPCRCVAGFPSALLPAVLDGLAAGCVSRVGEHRQGTLQSEHTGTRSLL